MSRATPRSLIATLATGLLLAAIFSALVIWFRRDLRAEIHLKIIERDAAVLYPMALQQIAESEAGGPGSPSVSVTALLRSARQRGMLAVAVFDREGNTIEAVPANQLFVELPTEDFLLLQAGRPISRYHPAFPLDQYFAGVSRDQGVAPVLEVLLPLPDGDSTTLRGFVRYYIDARPLSRELAVIDARINRQTAVTLAVGTFLIALVLAGAAFLVQRAQRLVSERNERLARANFELTLAAKASAIGQITSHLIHGMQGSVEGLRAVVASRDSDPASPAWVTAAGYTGRLQQMIQDTVALLGDAGSQTTYELTGQELAATIRQRNGPLAVDKGVAFAVDDGFAGVIDNHRGSLLCLIANNLVHNAILATEPGRHVSVSLADTGASIVLTVRDEGIGIPEAVRAHLFQAGRSGRPGGSGLGLAISQLLARQIGAEVSLASTGPGGTTFTVTVPRRE